MSTEIRHTLDLILHLMDTVSGHPLTGREVQIFRGDAVIHPLDKGAGEMILVDGGRKDFDLSIQAWGFLPQTIRVAYAELDPNFPRMDIPMIPSLDYRAPWPCLSMEGKLPGITGLRAARAEYAFCHILAFESKTKLLTLHNPYRLRLDGAHYSLADPNGGAFEPFVIVRRVSDQQVQIDRVLETKLDDPKPLSPVVFGAAASNGNYRLLVRDDGQEARWMVRWEAGKEVGVKTVDLRRPETCILL